MENDVFRLAERIFHRYEGNVQVEEKSVSITARNDFEDAHHIECKCSVSLSGSIEWPYAVDVHEHTYCIKGGRGMPCKDEKEVEEAIIACLQAFNFREKRQLSLFDL